MSSRRAVRRPRGGFGRRERAVQIYPRRSVVPRQVWRELFGGAQREIGILVYAGEFLARDDELMRIVATKAGGDVSVRILLGDPEAPAVLRRGQDEGIGEEMAAMARRALVRHRSLLQPHGAQIRLHGTVLYDSLYWADDEMLVNQHLFGIGAADAPVTHLRHAADRELAATYRRVFERVWASASRAAD
ncbi:MAG TPA: hypothetical protein VI248_14500 [Kineosporiaceae bacterium]